MSAIWDFRLFIVLRISWLCFHFEQIKLQLAHFLSIFVPGEFLPAVLKVSTRNVHHGRAHRWCIPWEEEKVVPINHGSLWQTLNALVTFHFVPFNVNQSIKRVRFTTLSYLKHQYFNINQHMRHFVVLKHKTMTSLFDEYQTKRI